MSWSTFWKRVSWAGNMLLDIRLSFCPVTLLSSSVPTGLNGNLQCHLSNKLQILEPTRRGVPLWDMACYLPRHGTQDTASPLPTRPFVLIAPSPPMPRHA